MFRIAQPFQVGLLTVPAEHPSRGGEVGEGGEGSPSLVSVEEAGGDTGDRPGEQSDDCQGMGCQSGRGAQADAALAGTDDGAGGQGGCRAAQEIEHVGGAADSGLEDLGQAGQEDGNRDRPIPGAAEDDPEKDGETREQGDVRQVKERALPAAVPEPGQRDQQRDHCSSNDQSRQDPLKK
jgi:hypothetical protein